MVQRKIQIIIAVLCGFVLFLCGFCSAQALDGEAFAAGVRIPVRFISSGAGESARAVFSLQAEDEGAPMPAGCAAREMTVTIRGEGTADFGEIRYTRPDLYHYTVRRSGGGSGALAADRSVYHVTVAVLRDGTASLMVQKDGEDAKSDQIVYRDRYGTGVRPETGDPAGPVEAAGLLLSACIGLWCVRTGFQRGGEEDES